MISAILLAAGESQRFGSPKMLHPLADGTPMALRSVTNLAAAVDRIVAIVPPAAQELIELLTNSGLAIDICTLYSDGMGRSLARGVRACRDSKGWLIALADMPFVLPTTIAAVAQALRAGAPIAAPTHDNRRGHPVGFGREYYAELAALSGDVGARDVVQRDAARIVLLPVDDPGIHRDIDVPLDLRTATTQEEGT